MEAVTYPKVTGPAPWTWRQWTVTVVALALLAAVSVAGGALLRHATGPHPKPTVAVTHVRTYTD